MSSQAINDFMKFVVADGEMNRMTRPALVAQAISSVTLHPDGKLIGAAATKMPLVGHGHSEIAKADMGSLATLCPYEIGWVVMDRAIRRQGHGRALVAMRFQLDNPRSLCDGHVRLISTTLVNKDGVSNA